MKYSVRPLSDVTGFDGGRQESAFTTSWSDALTLLDRELTMLKARDIFLELDVREDQIRLDGHLRGNTRPASARVRLAFDSKHGELVYATGRFWRGPGARFRMREDWQHNVYAIAKALEALRLVDRYGVTSGQQYTGFKALPSGTPMPTRQSMTSSAAAELLRGYADAGVSIESALRAAQRATHPDQGGDDEAFNRVQEAARVLGLSR